MFAEGSATGPKRVRDFEISGFHHRFQRLQDFKWDFKRFQLDFMGFKFIMKLSATCHAALGWCGESKRSNILTVAVRFFEIKLMYSVC